ncbi:protein arginine methyltransferase NDUFAF7, mitochondrial-like [Glandiceps talaboti]
MALRGFKATRLKFPIFGITAASGAWSKTNIGCRCYAQQSSNKTDLAHYLKQRIKLNGPITVAEYMKTVLTSPHSGYYMNKDVFGAKGDFITSPEISQMFGELLGVWIVHEWMLAGSPKQLHVVELGPGRGTLADDILRVFQQLKGIKDVVSLHLVEVSPAMRHMQELKLTGTNRVTERHAETQEKDGIHKTIQTKSGIPVTWYTNLQDVPTGTPSCFIAHEFFDALPIHKIQKTEKGWREVLVNTAQENSSNQFQFVLAPTDTSISKLFVKKDEKRDHVEVCPEGAVIVQDIADRVTQDGGNALIIDYGHDGTKGDTFRGFRNHKLHDVLVEPGSADLTADVDFSFLKRMVEGRATCHGPISQRMFLKNMGIDYRVQAIMKNASESHKKDLFSGYQMLTDPKQMGERFKFFAILPKTDKDNDRTSQKQRLPTGFQSAK